ncbi:hypothetical protein [Kitasatospora sp. NPDC088548]|uniref:hypothetical protein n=1 Tax=Kitasatospora sp. NPDC088548 TaxID=3364075 RepID=UPI00382F7FEA
MSAGTFNGGPGDDTVTAARGSGNSTTRTVGNAGTIDGGGGRNACTVNGGNPGTVRHCPLALDS